jgi:hypothetical protein
MVEIVHNLKDEFQVPPGLNIYRMRSPDVSEAALRRAGSRFGLRVAPESGTLILNARGSAYSEPSGWGLKMFRASGGWRYRHAARWQADDGRSHLTIDEVEASRLALDALARHALPTVPELEGVRVERLRVAHIERGGAHHQERVVGVRALFRRMLDGLPVEGPGGKTFVYLDHARELTGIDHLWRTIESVHERVHTLRPIEEALQEVRRRYGSGEGRVEVTSLRLGYFELGWDDDQEYLQPAYVFTLRLASADSRFRMNATVPVAAAVNAVGPIEPQVPRRVPQARRAR